MSRMVSTTRFSKVKDTNTAMFDQNGRRIAGGRATLAPGENVVKRGSVAAPPRAPSTTRVSSTTRMTATVRRPTSQRSATRQAPVVEEYDEGEAEDYEEARAERIRAQDAERAARNERKAKDTFDFHNKYYYLCQDKEKLEAYPGFRFGLHPPDPNDIHALGNYKMNLEECEKQEARQKKIAEAKAAAQAARGEVTRTGRPPARTPKTATAKGKTPGRKADVELMEEIDERHRARLEKQTLDFHYKYWPLCKDKVMLEAYPGFRFGMPVPEYDDLLAVNGYLLELKQFEAAEELAKNTTDQSRPAAASAAVPTAAAGSKKQTKAQKAKAEMDARVAAKRVSLRPPPPKVGGTTPKMGCRLPPGAEAALGARAGPSGQPRPPSAPRASRPVERAPPPEEPRGPPRQPRGPPPGYVEPRRSRAPPQAAAQAAAQGAAQGAAQAEPSGDIEVETETKVVIHEDMETRIYNLKQKAYEKGLYGRPPEPTPAMRAQLTPEEEPACPCPAEQPPPQRQPSPPRAIPGGARPRPGLRPPSARGLPQRTGSRIGGGRLQPPARGQYAKALTPVEVVSEGGAGRSILVPTDVATADHNTVVRVKRGTNVATPVDEEERVDDLPPYVPMGGPPPERKIDRNDPNLDAFDKMRLAEQDERERQEMEKLRQDLLNKRAAVAKLRQAAALLNQQKREMMERIDLMDDPLVTLNSSRQE